jgi:hypothetical protein
MKLSEDFNMFFYKETRTLERLSDTQRIGKRASMSETDSRGRKEGNGMG